MARLGADVARLDALARQFRRHGDELVGLRTSVDGALAATWWEGHHAEAFRHDWVRRLRPGLDEVAAALDHLGTRLAGEVGEQRRASDTAGVATAVGAAAVAGLAVGADAAVASTDPGAFDVAALDRSNRAAIDDELARLRAEQDRLDPGIDWWFVEDDADRHAALQHRIDSLTDLRDSLGQDAHLLAFDPAGDGRAVVALGDLATTEHVAVTVPGIGTDLDSYTGFLTRASNLRGAAQQAYGTDVATVAWLGYDAPGGAEWPPEVELVEAPFGRRAAEGAGDLRGFVDGVHATNPDAHVSVIGHSYGSRVTADAVRAEGLVADEVVFIGSPGVGVDHVDDLGAPTGTTVWAESAGTFGDRPWYDPLGVGELWGNWRDGGDPVPSLPSAHGGNPDHPDFGARGFALGDASGHSEYYRPASGGHDGRALDSLAAIASGHDPRPPEDGS